MSETKSKKEPKTPKFTPDDVDEDIPHPYLELYRHTMLRGANAGSLLPLVIAPPILFLRGVRKPGDILYRTARASLYGVAIGTVVTAIATYMTIRNDEEVLVWDRCYRLRYHKSQCHLDNVTYGVVATGAVAGALTSPIRATGALLGASLGFGLSVFAHMISKGKD